MAQVTVFYNYRLRFVREQNDCRRHRIVLTVSLAWLVIVAACAPLAKKPATKPTIASFPGTPTVQCVQEEVLPKIEEIQPAEIKPGTEVTIRASGGYLRDSCGGYNESSRTYKIYLDNEPVADLSCYVNHCEGKFRLAESTGPGSHCLGVQKGTCQRELQVAEE